MYEHSSKKLDEKTPDKYTFWKKLILNFKKYPMITMEDCKNYKNEQQKEKERIESDFRELRNIVHDLGDNTWSLTKFQTFCFALGIITYFLSF